MKEKISLVLVGSALLLLALASPGYSCVGRVLTVSVNDSIEQKLMGQMLATYITERTGTTVNMTSALDIQQSEEQIKECKADIFINYINAGLNGIEGADKNGAQEKNYSLVKQYYVDKYNMVWLKPFGYKGPIMTDSGQNESNVSLAVPVTTRDVLNRFPVLDRVINKLSGRIDEKTLEQLIQKTQTEEIPTVVKNFLADQNLI